MYVCVSVYVCMYACMHAWGWNIDLKWNQQLCNHPIASWLIWLGSTTLILRFFLIVPTIGCSRRVPSSSGWILEPIEACGNTKPHGAVDWDLTSHLRAWRTVLSGWSFTIRIVMTVHVWPAESVKCISLQISIDGRRSGAASYRSSYVLLYLYPQGPTSSFLKLKIKRYRFVIPSPSTTVAPLYFCCWKRSQTTRRHIPTNHNPMVERYV